MTHLGGQASFADRLLSVTIDGRPPTGNVREGWQTRARTRRVWREKARLLALEARNAWEREHGTRWLTATRCVVSVAFGLPDRRTRDLDNLIASAKPLLDGLVDAGILADDSIGVIQKMEYGAAVTGRAETVIAVDVLSTARLKA